MLIAGCNNDPKNIGSNKQYQKVKSKVECVEPQNPYNDGGGHDAGFNWASENGGNCNGNSDSFNEGCEEYASQLNQYNECVARRRKQSWGRTKSSKPVSLPGGAVLRPLFSWRAEFFEPYKR